MSNKQTVSLTLVGLLIASVIICSSVFAYMFKQSDLVDNKFTPAIVDCEVVESVTESGSGNVTQKNEIKVTNTGNIPSYIRLRLVSYWVRIVDGKNEVIQKASSLPTFEISSDWIKGANDTYYYKEKVDPSATTPNLLASGKTITLATDGDYYQVIEIFAEAIQGAPANAVTSSWGVTLDSNGNITAP